MRKSLLSLALAGTCLTSSHAAAAVVDFTVDGSDAIFLAGRSDLTIPDPSQPWGSGVVGVYDGMLRHSGPTPEEIKETLPPLTSLVAPGDTVRVLDPAIGGISFFNGFGAPLYGPDGNPVTSILREFAGISGYKGTQGALVGVFLDDSIPNGASQPPTLDFTPSGIGTEFTSLSPDLRQIFFIGDGKTSGGVFQEFIAPAGTTRLVLGIPDGFGFNGVPGAYDDNDGSYRVRVGINEIPPDVPLPASVVFLGAGVVSIAALRRRRK